MAPRLPLLWLLCGIASGRRTLRSRNSTALGLNTSKAFDGGADGAPQCQCIANDPSWTAPTRTNTKCVFIDLGAADGNTFWKFIHNGYGPVANCPNGGDWEAILVEANPQFTPDLEKVAAYYPGKVQALGSHAAWSCMGQTSFFIDTDPTHNHWGSSMSEAAPDAIRSGKQKVTVPTVNVVELIAKNVIPGDWVMLKVDIEGAEYEVVPCLAEYASASNVDIMYLEEHTWFDSGTGKGPNELAAAKYKLQSKGVQIPGYFSQTL